MFTNPLERGLSIWFFSRTDYRFCQKIKLAISSKNRTIDFIMKKKKRIIAFIVNFYSILICKLQYELQFSVSSLLSFSRWFSLMFPAIEVELLKIDSDDFHIHHSTRKWFIVSSNFAQIFIQFLPFLRLRCEMQNIFEKVQKQKISLKWQSQHHTKPIRRIHLTKLYCVIRNVLPFLCLITVVNISTESGKNFEHVYMVSRSDDKTRFFFTNKRTIIFLGNIS